MYELLENKRLVKMREHECWTYILKDEERFSRSGFKSAQFQLKDCMLKCSVIRFNGQLKLIYFPEEYKNLIDVLGNIQPNKVWHVFEKILESVIKVKDYGYLDCENIDIAPKNIYINPKTLEASLIYIPLITDNQKHYLLNFEDELKRSFVSALRESNNAMVVERENKLLEIFSEAGQSLEEIRNAMMKQSDDRPVQLEEHQIGKLHLNSIDRFPPMNYEMNGERITIGRKKDNDFVIEGSNYVSRVHCSIFMKNERYYVVDEKSTYGTYVNKTMCTAGSPIELHNKDILKLPGIQFEVNL